MLRDYIAELDSKVAKRMAVQMRDSGTELELEHALTIFNELNPTDWVSIAEITKALHAALRVRRQLNSTKNTLPQSIKP